ncbi:MAG: exonuclease domain-containing protein, partial [Thermoleophilia bacterium]
DFETTGFSARKADRVVEIGVVCMDHSGEVIEEWTTLVSPERDVSAGHIHGIAARDVYGAPRFEEVAGLLAESLRGRVLVAHNLSFEAQFLMGEFARLGHELQLDRSSGICTMTLASTYIPHSPRNLQACCDCCGVELQDAHSALADARATTQLLGRYISVDEEFADRWAHCFAQSLQVQWPALPADRGRVKPRGAAAASDAAGTYVGRLAAHLPAVGGSGVTDSYLEVLDRALIDRILALHEMDELIALARDLGLSRQQTHRAHRDYLDALVRQAWSDGALNDAETADLLVVASLLGIGESELQGSVRAAAEGAGGRAGSACRPPVGAFALEPGDRIVFTGEEPGVSRDQLCYEAEARGMRPMGSVSGKTKVVVASDPDSISGKARKARECGVPVIDFAAYFRLRDRMDKDAV